MDQQYPTTPPASPAPPPAPPAPATPPPPPPAPSKEWGARETITVIFLVLFPIVGLILMWALANWSKKAKVIITVALLLPMIAFAGILSSIVLVSMGDVKESARDTARKADMRQVVSAQEMYYAESDAYYTSVTYPSRIGFYMPDTPTDPNTEGPYGWIDNTRDSQKFCAYADLEKDGFYTATHMGSFEVAAEPRTFSDCTP